MDFTPTRVVDYKLRVYGVMNLGQADIGIAPYVPSGNTNAPEKAAAMIKKAHSQ